MDTDLTDPLAYLRARAASILPEAVAAPVSPPVETPVLATQVGGSHYKDMKIQPLEYCIANNIPFAEGGIIKYVSRWRKKNGVEDLRKARHMLDVLIEFAEKEAQNG